MRVAVYCDPQQNSIDLLSEGKRATDDAQPIVRSINLRITPRATHLAVILVTHDQDKTPALCPTSFEAESENESIGIKEQISMKSKTPGEIW